MAHAHIGTVYIKVAPDSKRFRKEVEDQIGKQPLKQKLDIDVDEKDLAKQIDDGVGKAMDDLKGRHKLKISHDFDGVKKALGDLQSHLRELEQTEIEVNLSNPHNTKKTIEQLQKMLQGDGRKLVHKMEIIPDEQGHKEVLAKIEDLHRAAQKPMKIEFRSLDDDSLKAAWRHHHKKLAEEMEKTPLLTPTMMLEVETDYESLTKQIGEIESQLHKVTNKKRVIPVELDKAGLDEALERLERDRSNIKTITIDVNADEAGLRREIQRIQSILDSRREKLLIETDLDTASLEARLKTLNNMLDKEVEKKRDIKFTYSDDIIGFEKVARKIRELKNEKLELEVDLNVDDSELDRLQEHFLSKSKETTIRPKVDLFALGAVEAQLGAAARDRWVNLKPRISARALADIEGVFLAIAGLNSIRTLVDTIRNIALDFDNWSVQVGAVSAGIGSLVSAGVVGLGALLKVAGDTLQVFQGLAMAPAILLSGAAALQTWRAVWNNFGDAIDGDDDALEKLPKNAKAAVGAIQELDKTVNRTVQNNFWGQMTDEVERFTDTIGPYVVKVMGNTATVMGKTISKMLDHTELLAKNGSLDEFTKNHTKAMTFFGQATENAFKALMEMGIQGSKQLPRLGMWVRDLSHDFSGFINEATRTGKFDAWIENSIRSMKSLGTFSKATWNILAGVTRAFDNQGGAGLHEMADGMERISNWVNRGSTQIKMQGIFQAAMDGAAAAGRGFADLSKAAWDYSDELGGVLRTSGQLAGDFLSTIAKIDFSIAFRGFYDLMHGMSDFVLRAQPGFEAIVNTFGRLGSIGGEVAREVAHGMNLTMGAIDGFLARIQGPLINAVQPLTRVFEDLAALGTPVLFAMADSLGVVLNLFSQLPAPIQNTVTLLAILGRTGALAGLGATIGKLGNMMHVSARQISAGAGVIETRLMTMRRRIGGSMTAISRTMTGAFGGWIGIALTGLVAGLSAMAGNAALAEAAQQRLRESLDATTGAMTEQTRVAVFENINKEYGKLENYWKGRPLSASFESEANEIGLSANQIATELTRTSGSAEEFVGILDQLYSAWADPDEPATTAQLQALATELGYAGDVSMITRESMRAMGTVLSEVRPQAEGLGKSMQAAANELLAAEGGFSAIQYDAESLTPKMRDLAEAMSIVGDDASSASQQVDAFRDAMARLSGQDVDPTELLIQSAEAIDRVKSEAEAALQGDGIDWNDLFKGGKGINPQAPQARLFKDGIDGYLDGLSREIIANKELMTEEEFMEYLPTIPAKWQGELKEDFIKAFKIPEEHMEAFGKIWDNYEFDPVNMEFVFKGEQLLDKATQDFARLDKAGMELSDKEFIAKMGLDGEGAVTEAEYLTAMAKEFDQLHAEADFDANPDRFNEILGYAVDSGLYFDGQSYQPIFDADGKPFDEAITRLRSDGYEFNGEKFVALADVKTDGVTDSIADLANNAEEVWNGKEYIAVLDADGEPTKEMMELAHKLGLEWDGEEFIAVVDAEGGDNAREEVTQAREALLQYEGTYRAMLEAGVEPGMASTIAGAIADADEFEGDYTAFLEAVKGAEGEAALAEFLGSLEDVPEDVQAELLALFTGAEVVKEAGRALQEIDEKKAESEIDAEYTGRETVEEAKGDVKELGGRIPKIEIEAEYTGRPEADSAKEDAEIIDVLNPLLSFGSDYDDTGAESAKTDATALDGKQVGWSIIADATDSSTKVEETKTGFRLLDQLIANPTISQTGAEETKGEIDGASASATTFGLLSPTAALGVSGVGDVIAGSASASGAAEKVDGNFISNLMTVGGPMVVAAAISAFNADDKVDDSFISKLLSVGSGGVVSAATSAFNASDKVDGSFQAKFSETGAGGVTSQANTVKGSIDSINKSPTISFGGRILASFGNAISRVKSSISAMLGAGSSADGSLTGSRFKMGNTNLLSIQQFANGGFGRENHVAQIAPAGNARTPFRVWAEPETGGEAYIPLSPSKRARSLAIWEETGRRLNAFADGGITTDAAPGRNTTIYVTNHYPKAEPVSRTVNDGLDYAAVMGFN